jgi:ubiquitin-protein ligase
MTERKSAGAAAPTSSSLKRIMRDYAEYERSPLNTIAAAPLSGNMFEWHVNLKPRDGVYSGKTFHLIIRFPSDYPNKPPSVG